MFGRRPTIVHVNQPQHTEYVTRNVIEKRAPTDESVALLREMEQAAEARLIASIRLSNTPIDCVVRVERSAMSDEFIAHAITKVNGQTIEAEARVPTREEDKLKIVRDLIDRLGQEIAKMLIAKAVQQIKLPL